MTTMEKGVIAEDRAYDKYGGIKHYHYNGTIPDLVRIHNGYIELIEVKYIDLSKYTSIQSRLCKAREQIKKRKERWPDGTKQRVYVLITNKNDWGWTDEEVAYTIIRELSDLNVAIDIERMTINNDYAASN